MIRLPKPGQDVGQWGNLLVDYLSAGHNPDGTDKNADAPRSAAVVKVASSGPAQSLDMLSGEVFEITLTANCNLSLVNVPQVTSFGLILRQDGSGNRNVTWSFPVAWPGSSAPAIPESANASAQFTFLTTSKGNIWYPGIIRI